LTALAHAPDDAKNFSTWVKVFDRVSAGETQPKEKARPGAAEMSAFTRTLEVSLVARRLGDAASP
jgi:hypothetical protein